jgi:hypothetical protein
MKCPNCLSLELKLNHLKEVNGEKEKYRLIMKKIIKSIPSNMLISILFEMKILKKEFVGTDLKTMKEENKLTKSFERKAVKYISMQLTEAIKVNKEKN